MHLPRTKALLEKIQTMDIPLSSTTRGEQIHQTFRNQLTTELKNALYEDLLVCLAEDSSDGILPYLVKEGVILEIPNAGVADRTDPEQCSGAISVEWSFTFKGLDYFAPEAAADYDFQTEKKRKEAEEAAKKREEKRKRDEANRAARAEKRRKLVEQALRFSYED